MISYLRRPPPPPPPRPPPPRELPMLEAPRELLARALLPLREEPPKASPLRDPPPADVLRLPTRSPPPLRFPPLSLVPALGRFPPRSPRSPSPPPRFAPLSPAPPAARLPTPPCCCRWRAFAWRFAMESPRAVPPYLLAVERFA